MTDTPFKIGDFVCIDQANVPNVPAVALGKHKAYRVTHLERAATGWEVSLNDNRSLFPSDWFLPIREQRKVSIPIYHTAECMPPEWTVVLVEGGVAKWTGRLWLSMMDKDQRAIGWPITWWSPLLQESHFEKSIGGVGTQ